MTIMVTGGTGKLGARVLTALRQQVGPGSVVVLARTPERAKPIEDAGFQVRLGDYDRPETLEPAFTGIDRLLVISASSFDDDVRLRQHQAVFDAAAAAQVGFIAYTSLPRATTTPMSVAVVHKAAEEGIIATGIPYSFLRNNWYLENEIEEIDTVQRVIAGHPVITAAGSGRTGWVLREELGIAAANVIAGAGHENTVYELSGPPKTYDEFAGALSRVLGREVPVQHVDDQEFSDDLKARDVPWADLLVDFQAELRDGLLDVESDDLARVLRRQPTPLADGLAKLIDEYGLLAGDS